MFWVVFVEGEREYTICGEEGFLDAISVMQINVNV